MSRRSAARPSTQSVVVVRSHAERGNELPFYLIRDR
jgi:hypothetical protein